MNERDFLELLDIYGADIARWPAEVQDEAGRFLANSPPAHRAARQAAEFDRLLLESAPLVEPKRVDRAVLAVVSRAAAKPQPAHALARLVPSLVRGWAPTGAVYFGLFTLGCLANLAMRLMAAEAPLERLFSGNFLLPLGG